MGVERVGDVWEHVGTAGHTLIAIFGRLGTSALVMDGV